VRHYFGLPLTTQMAEMVGKIKFPENKERHPDELSKLLTRLVKMEGPLTLVMDEANLMFTPNGDQKDLRAAKKYLEVLTALSKESQQVHYTMLQYLLLVLLQISFFEVFVLLTLHCILLS
jgi:hypothetical protein